MSLTSHSEKVLTDIVTDVTAVAQPTTMAEIPAWIFQLAKDLIRTADTLLGDESGPARKVAVMAKIKSAYDELCKRVDIPYLPELIEQPLEQYLWTLAEPWVSVMVEGLVERLRLEQRFSRATTGQAGS